MSTLTTRRMTVEEYRLTHEDDRTELIEGVVVEKMTKNRAHSIGATNSRQAIERVLPPGWHAGAETPVLLPGVATLKEPDVSVIRGAANDYAEIDPGPPDVALIAEVSDTSVAEGATGPSPSPTTPPGCRPTGWSTSGTASSRSTPPTRRPPW